MEVVTAIEEMITQFGKMSNREFLDALDEMIERATSARDHAYEQIGEG